MLGELTNIIDELAAPPIFTDAERNELLETCLQMFDDAINEEPVLFTEPTFDDVVNRRVFSLLCETLGYDTLDFYTIEAIQTVLSEAYELYSATHVVRSLPRTMVLKAPDVEQMKNHIKYLSDIPQPDQRTDDWYKFRHKYLTASSIWKAFGSVKTQNELIYDKCKPLDVSKYTQPVNTESPLHWGQKYEEVSVMWYEREYTTKISDYGCLPHREISYLAASPDGIVTDAASDRFGRMLEIKNIVNRDITGIPKKEYWIQMQLQMEVCKLDECDFLETRFKEYENHAGFVADGTFTHTADGKLKGHILYFNKAGAPFYKYAPLGIDEAEYETWEASSMEKHAELTLVRTIYWRLDEVSCVLVLRNRTWFNHVKPTLDDFWAKIVHDREHGYEHRAPQRKSKPAVAEDPSKQCLIDVSTLESGKTTSAKKCIIDVDNLVFNIDTD